MIDTKKEKKKIRNEILKIRKSLSVDKVQDLSKIIVDRIQNCNYYSQADKVCIYMPINNEVDLLGLTKDTSKTFYIPKVTGKEMEFYEYQDGDKLIKGSFDILEPTSTNKLIPDTRTLIIMPGAVFSLKGDRIGYGGGYYDRYLFANSLCKTISVCYDFQILDNIPVETHDIKPDLIISDKKQMEVV